MDIDEVFGEGGILERNIGGFRRREGQVSMALTVLDSIRERRRVVAEGGTGLGKTYAYLVPLLLTGARALVSTGTKNLQDQLFSRDIPELSRALGMHPDVRVLKGRQNYLCKLRLARERELPLEEGDGDEWQRIELFAQATADGDLDGLGADVGPQRRAALASTRESCTVRECPHYDSCFFYEARRAAREAQITVVNHHLYLADLTLRDEERGEILPDPDVVVFDEAHHLPETATDCFGRRVSSDGIVRALDRLLKEAGTVRQENRAARRDRAGLRDSHRRLLEAVADRRVPGDPARASVTAEKIAADAAASGALGKFCDRVADAAHAVRANTELPLDLRAQAAAFAETADHLRRWAGLPTADPDSGEVRDPGDEPVARWAEAGEQGIAFNSAPVEVGGLLGRHFADPGRAFVFTSATLSSDESLAPFADAVGLEDPVTGIWESPFDYARCGVTLVPSGIPSPRHGDPDAHTQGVVGVAAELARVSGGRAFVLFTSLRAMRRAAEGLRERLEPEGISVLLQGEESNPRLIGRFLSGEPCVLVGSNSFATGIDIPGPALSVVVLDKLPFMPPDDPLLAARERRCRENGGRPFDRIQLPHAALRVRQVAGRLIRSPADRGVFVLCDPRVCEKAYGRRILSSLPPMRFTRDIEVAKEMLGGAR